MVKSVLFPKGRQPWMPDWRSSEGYPRQEVTEEEKRRGILPDPPVWWAWEFLRRNPGYQRVFDMVIAEIYDDKSPSQLEDVYGQFDVDDPVALRDQFGICFLYNPAVNRPMLFQLSRAREPYFVQGIGEPQVICLPPHQIMVAFDLTQEFGPQLDKASNFLKRRVAGAGRFIKQPKATGVFDIEAVAQGRNKLQQSEWRSFLRVLDAWAEGATNREIATNLLDERYPPGSREGDSDVKNLKTAAKKMMESGFRKLLEV